MLSLAESGPIFRFMSICSSLLITPFGVDKESGKLRNFSNRKYLIWVFLYSIVILHYVHGFTQFVALLTFRQDEIVLFHLAPQFDVVVGPLVFHPFILTIFLFQRDIVVKVFNELYDSKTEDKEIRPLKKLSLQEMLALGSGIIVTGCVTFYFFMLILMHDMAHLLINNPHLKFLRTSAIAVAISTLIETWTVAIWVLNVGFFLQLNALVLSKLEAMGKDLVNLKYVFRQNLSFCLFSITHNIWLS